MSITKSSTELDEKYLRMTETPVEKLIFSLALPCISIMLISAFYNAADTYFVGSLGTGATASVGVSLALMNVIQAVGFMFGHGAGNYIARQMGAHNWEAASSMAATGFLTALGIGFAIAACGLTFLEPLARFLGATETMLPNTCDYIFYILLGAPWMASSIMLNNLLRYQGSAFYSMWGMIGGAILNVALDPLFIFTFGMGVGGAGLATMISQFVSFSLLLVGCSCKGNVSINVKKFSPHFAFYKEILRGGSPTLFRQSVGSVAAICLNQTAALYGIEVIAAISIVQRVVVFANSVLFGFGQAFQPVCGFNYGAKRYDRVKKAFWFCVKISTSLLFVCSVLGYFFAPYIIAVFRRDDPEVIKIGALTLRLQCATLPLMGWIILNNMMSQTMGKAFEANLMALTRQGLFLLPALFILTPVLGVLGIQLSQPIGDICAFLIAIPLGLRVLREISKGAPTSTEMRREYLEHGDGHDHPF